MEFIEVVQHTMQILDIQAISFKRLSKQLQACAVQFRNIAFRYDFLAQSQFGTEKELLQVIESYKICALACEHAVRTFVGSDQLFFCIDPSLIPLISKEPATNISAMDSIARMMELCRGFVRTATHWEELAHLEETDRRTVR
jgi:integrator complex subunit 7